MMLGRHSFVLLAMIAGMVCGGGRLAAQETPMEVRKAASQALAEGAFADAVPLLQQLIAWFKDSSNPSLRQELERYRFSLGMSLYVTGQMGPALAAYDDYLANHRRGVKASEAAVYRGDTFRFEQQMDKAVAAYAEALQTYQYDNDWRADIEASLAKCHLADEKWTAAIPHLIEVYRRAPDWDRRNWAASLLAMSYLQDRQLEKVYDMMSVLLRPDSFASRSIALNLSALEVGDELFADERYRDALWIYRIVYPHDLLALNNMLYLDRQEARSRRLRRHESNIRRVVRIQESMGQVEQELEALEQVQNYDDELFYRIARSSMEIRRYRESCELFYHLYQDDIPEKAEECLYLAFSSAAALLPFDRAIELGLEYMEVYPAKEYYDTVSLMVGQFYVKLQEWPKALEVLKKALEVSPEHEQIAEVMFMIGYCEFMEENFADSADWLRRLLQGYPGNDRMPDATYWLGMALLFDTNYEEAVLAFEDVISLYPDCVYVEDASFRSATCDYGMAMYESAERKLLDFVRKFPDGTLAGEAYVMLGDVAGTFGDLHTAVAQYRKAFDYDINIELYNHAVFRSAEMYDEMNAYQDMVSHFEDYLKRARPGSNAPLAMYWIGNAYWKMGEQRRTLDFYMDAISKFADERMATGVDLLIEEWIAKVKSAEPELREESWTALRKLFRRAIDENKMTMVLRVQQMFLYNNQSSEKEKQTIHAFIVRERSIRDAPISTLEYIMDAASQDGDSALAAQAAQEIIEVFPETDTALYARNILARQAMERGDYDIAIAHLDVIREVFASSPEAAEALLLLAGIYEQRSQFDKADQCYTEVLGVKEWKNLWPQALYGRGQISMKDRDYAKASAYFERIYILYRFYDEWVAKAYLARADCLEKMREPAKAVEVLEEMMSTSELAEGPYGDEAAQMLDRLRRRA
jgi:tetratricopeptide (TPR) repeat protein